MVCHYIIIQLHILIQYIYTARRKINSPRSTKSDSSSGTSRISSRAMEHIIDRLKNKQVRESTNKNYLSIWRLFNKFLIRLDRMPNSWEDRVALFCAYMIDEGAQSQTIRSYVSAIKAILLADDYSWSDDKVILTSLTKACRIQNDILKCRLPINKNLLGLILFELKRVLPDQFYLQVLFRALFSLAYYGMMRVGELAEGTHSVRASNIHSGTNKNKILIILFSSKTHGKESYPQQIKIAAEYKPSIMETTKYLFCPFQAVRSYLTIRGDYIDDDEHFFIYRDKKNVLPGHVRRILRLCLTALNLDPSLYDTHSFRIGRTGDLWKDNWDLDRIKKAGRWRSNAVYKYLRTV